MSTFRSLLGLALACVVVTASIARADVTPMEPLRLHLGRIATLPESTAPAADVTRITEAVRATLGSGMHDIERCASHVHGGFSWRDYTVRHARVRVVWDSSSSPSETAIVSSTFAHEIGTCLRNGLRTIAVTPAPAGRVALTVGFDRD